MFDTGLFDPIIRKFIKLINGDPMKAVVFAALLAGLVFLDGDGSMTYMITVTAMLPLFKRLRLAVITHLCGDTCGERDQSVAVRRSIGPYRSVLAG